MKKHLGVLIVLFTLVLLFVFYENYKARKEIQLAWDFWSNATEQAWQKNSTTKEFYTQYSSLGDLESDDTISNPALVQNVPLSGFLCSEYTFRIHYSSNGGDGSKLVFLSGKGHGMLCFI